MILTFPSAYRKSAWRILKSLAAEHPNAFSVLFLSGDESHFINALAPAVSMLAQSCDSAEIFVKKIGFLLTKIAQIIDSARNFAEKYADFLREKGVFLAIKRKKSRFRRVGAMGCGQKRKLPEFFMGFAKRAILGEEKVVCALNRAFCLAEVQRIYFNENLLDFLHQ